MATTLGIDADGKVWLVNTGSDASKIPTPWNGIALTGIVLTPAQEASFFALSPARTTTVFTAGTFGNQPTSIQPKSGSPESVDGAIRLLGGASNRLLDLWARNGNGLFLFDGVTWQYTPMGSGTTLQTWDVLDCTIDGVAHKAATPDVDYMAYAYRDANGNGKHDFSTTGPAFDGPTGFVIKNGDATRRLIGGFRYMSGGIGLGIGAQSYNMGTWFNRLTINVASPQIGGSTQSASWTRITADNNRLTIWSWGDGTEPTLFASGTITNLAGKRAYVGIGIDGAAPSVWEQYVPSYDGQEVPFCVVNPVLAVGGGLHTYDLMLKTDPGGTAQIVSHATLTAKIND